MKIAESLAAMPFRLRWYQVGLLGCWTLAIAATLLLELMDEQKQARDIALSEARGANGKHLAIARSVAAIGGVYVPLGEGLAPDPYLAKVPDRDLTTPSGRKLTLANPMVVMRRVHGLADQQTGLRAHVTSLKPLRPANAPDPWEAQALEAIALGRSEVSSQEDIAGERYMRLMRPMIVEESCVKCHGDQGYRVGELRGGISVSVPMASVWLVEQMQILHRLLAYGGMWLLGVGGIVFMSRHLRLQVDRRRDAEQRLQEAHDALEARVEERTAELAREIAERKQAEAWLLESEQRFRGYFEQGLVGMAILSPEKTWVELNQCLAQMLGYSETELGSTNWTDLIPPEDAATDEAQFERVLDGRIPGYTSEKRFLRKDGRLLETNVSMQCLRKPDGSVDCILVMVEHRNQGPRQP